MKIYGSLSKTPKNLEVIIQKFEQCGFTIWATTCQNQQNAQSDQSSLCAQWVAIDPRFLHVNSEDWSDWADAQSDLSLRLAHTHFVGFVMLWLI